MKKFWPEILAFGAILAVLMIDLNPDFTFMNKAADSIGYIYSSQYLYPSYHTSPPLYLLISHLFLMIPYGTEAWRMGLVSVLSTMGACVFIYLSIGRLTQRRLLQVIGILLYGLSALVLSQSIIVNTYATTTMLAAGAYYFYLRKNWKLMGLMIGIGLAVHLLMAFVFLVFFLGVREYRKNWKALAVTFSFIIFYIYLPLTNREPYMWLPDPHKVNTIWAMLQDVWATITTLIGSLAIYDLPKRILDIFGVLGISLAGIAFIPIVAYFWKTKFWKSLLFWLALVPILIFMGELDMNTFDYMMIAMPFLAIIACLGLIKLNRKALTYATAVLVVGVGIYNINYFDIGRTLDPNLSATNLYRNEFAKIPDKAIFMPNYAWEWEAIYKYNADTGKHIYPICMDILPNPMYQQKLFDDGIQFETNSSTNSSISSKLMAQSIVRYNGNVWTTIVTDSYTFGSKVVLASQADIIFPDQQAMEAMIENPQIQWIPYNPYQILDTSIFETKWALVLMSNRSVLFYATLAGIGLCLYYLMFMRSFRRKHETADTEDIK